MAAATEDDVSTGIDFSAQPSGTAIAVIAWRLDHAELVDVRVGADDRAVRAALTELTGPVGIDCPLGWPSTLVEFLRQHEAGQLPVDADRAEGWRRRLVNRRTDLFVHSKTGQVPLSVGADRISHAALRLAALLADLGARLDSRRDGSGDIVEVYPAAALRVWGLPHTSYKGKDQKPNLRHLVDGFREAAPWLNLGDHAGQCESSDDAFDAVVCAMVARAAVCRATIAPTHAADRGAALREGWIHLPHGALPAEPWQRVVSPGIA